MAKIRTRMGDGSIVEVSESELKQALEDGTNDAAERGGIPPLSQDELSYLFDIFSAPYKFISIEDGREIVLTYDCPTLKLIRTGALINRAQGLQLYEKCLGADTTELAHNDYCFKAVKPIIPFEQAELTYSLLITTIPLLYGAMPSLGTYTQPDGPFPNPMELLPQGKINEAKEAFEGMVEYSINDIVSVSSAMYESGADGIDIDTAGALGDPDFLASLRATEILKQKYPNICVEIGMAGEFVLGTHGGLTYDGIRLAGLYPHKQVEVAEKAGATIFGPAINTSTKKTCAWNVARATTFVKACVQNANIPVHANVGMGVGGVPSVDQPPFDMVSRASAAMAEIARLDGL
jgi:dimethylamine--corrinoid protein Co-methyltransferase